MGSRWVRVFKVVALACVLVIMLPITAFADVMTWDDVDWQSGINKCVYRWIQIYPWGNEILGSSSITLRDASGSTCLTNQVTAFSLSLRIDWWRSTTETGTGSYCKLAGTGTNAQQQSLVVSASPIGPASVCDNLAVVGSGVYVWERITWSVCTAIDDCVSNQTDNGPRHITPTL